MISLLKKTGIEFARSMQHCVLFCLFCLFPAFAQSPYGLEFRLDNGATVILAPRPGCGVIHAAWFFGNGLADDYSQSMAELLLDVWFADFDTNSTSGFWSRATHSGIGHGRDIAIEELGNWCRAEMQRVTGNLGQKQLDTAKKIMRIKWQEPDTLNELYALVSNGNGHKTFCRNNIAWLNAITIKDLNAATKKSNALFILVGDVENIDAVKILNDTFGKLEFHEFHKLHDIHNAKTEDAPHPPPTERIKEITIDTDSEVLVAWPIPPLIHAHIPALEIIAEILAGNSDSRLTGRLIDKSGCSSYVEIPTDFYGGQSGNLFVIRADVTDGHTVQKVKQAIEDELRQVLDAGITPTEINRAVHRITAKHAVHLADASRLAQTLAVASGNTGEWESVLQQPFYGINVEPQTLMPVLRSVFQPEATFSVLAERDILRSPISTEHARLIELLSGLMAHKAIAPTQQEKLLKETLRQFGLMPPEARSRFFSMIESEIEHVR